MTMEEKMKPAYRVAYAIVNDEGNWHTSKEGALLAYTNEVDAKNGLKIHGGARILRCKVFFDGTKEASYIEPQEGGSQR
jgi:hypothetical protein